MTTRDLIRALLVLLLAALAFAPEATQATPRPGTWTVTGSLHVARSAQTATLLPDGQVLVAGGSANDSNALASAELYTPRTGMWTQTGSMHTPRLAAEAILLPTGQVLVAGGCGDTSCTTVLASAELYNPRTGTWMRTGSLHRPQDGLLMTLLPTGQVLAAGGGNGNAGLRDAELYHPRTGAWTVTGSLHEANGGFTAPLLPSGQVFIVGGCHPTCNDTILASAELYHPRTGTWTMTASMHTPRCCQPTTLLPTGQVLVAGGCSASGCSSVVASAELYHPRTGTWTVTGSLHAARRNATGTLLPGGQVLVVGGCPNVQCVTPLGSAEIYHPDTGTWTLTASLHTPRTGQTATRLPNGRVLVAGGIVGGYSNGTPLASAELYHP